MLHLLPSSAVLGTNLSAQLLNNEGCISLRLGEVRRAAVMFNRAVTESCLVFANGVLSQGPQSKLVQWSWEQAGRVAVAQGLYNSGLVALKVPDYTGAFRFFQHAAKVSERSSLLVGKPHVWVRMAECCLQLHELEQAADRNSRFPAVEVCSRGKSRRVFLR